MVDVEILCLSRAIQSWIPIDTYLSLKRYLVFKDILEHWEVVQKIQDTLIIILKKIGWLLALRPPKTVWPGKKLSPMQLFQTFLMWACF